MATGKLWLLCFYFHKQTALVFSKC